MSRVIRLDSQGFSGFVAFGFKWPGRDGADARSNQSQPRTIDIEARRAQHAASGANAGDSAAVLVTPAAPAPLAALPQAPMALIYTRPMQPGQAVGWRYATTAPGSRLDVVA